MEQDNEQTSKPIKIERLQQSIDDIDAKINKLLMKKEELKNEFENVQKNEILAIITSTYKTPEEVAAFIKQANNGGFVVALVKQEEKEKREEKPKERTGENGILLKEESKV